MKYSLSGLRGSSSGNQNADNYLTNNMYDDWWKN